MTFFTLRIREWPAMASEADLTAGPLESAVICELNDYARAVGPYGLSGWVKKVGAPLFYVDNCWVRARVSGRQVQQFSAEVLGGLDLSAFVTEVGQYLIEAEEY
jgi:hypothetical protein